MSAVDCESAFATVVWTPRSENNANITGYTVYYRSMFDGDLWLVGATTDDDSRSADVADLRPWTNYTFAVTANNSVGESDKSDTASSLCTTPPAKPYRNPETVCTAERDTGTLVITWKVSFK